jgi:hypothetical protein
VVVVDEYGKVNISQHIDRIRIARINPFFACTFLKGSYGQRQIERVIHGVDSSGISFGRIRAILIPELSIQIQAQAEEQYLAMSQFHERGMAIKERLLNETRIEPGRYGEEINALAKEKPAYKRAMREAKERLDHLTAQLEAVIEGKQQVMEAFPA